MTGTFQVKPPETILLDGLPLPHGQEVVPCCETCQTGQFVLEDFTCARSRLHTVRDLRTNKVIVIGGRGYCWHCGEQCDDDSFSHAACKASYEEHLKDCRCPDILEKDKSRHFKECPKRAEHPEPSVARANAAELEVERMRAVVAAAQKMAKFVPINAENQDLYNAHWELNKAVAKYEKP